MEVYRRMLRRYGPQHWWPAEGPFETMVGAVLTQRTIWANAERAIDNLRDAGALSPEALRRMPLDRLASLLYPAGYYNSKARKLKALAGFLGGRYRDDPSAMAMADTVTLRRELLAVYGVGEETADAILLYAAEKPAFVVDAYTRRVFARLRLAPRRDTYAAYREMFMGLLDPDPVLFNEYHALIVRHGKEVCKTHPVCKECCLRDVCPTGGG
jgi:endonuclease-3 related protein